MCDEEENDRMTWRDFMPDAKEDSYQEHREALDEQEDNDVGVD